MERTVEAPRSFTDCLTNVKVSSIVCGAGVRQMGAIPGNPAMKKPARWAETSVDIETKSKGAYLSEKNYNYFSVCHHGFLAGSLRQQRGLNTHIIFPTNRAVFYTIQHGQRLCRRNFTVGRNNLQRQYFDRLFFCSRNGRCGYGGQLPAAL